jgi:flagellar biogenesis protein FliO
MGGYVANFTVYTMAMVGLIFFALFAYKKFMNGINPSKKSEFLGIEESISIAPRKNLYVVRAGNEKFLVASDADRTTLISKLGDKPKRIDRNEDLPVIVDFPNQSAKGDQPIIKEMLKKINEI